MNNKNPFEETNEFLEMFFTQKAIDTLKYLIDKDTHFEDTMSCLINIMHPLKNIVSNISIRGEEDEQRKRYMLGILFFSVINKGHITIQTVSDEEAVKLMQEGETIVGRDGITLEPSMFEVEEKRTLEDVLKENNITLSKKEGENGTK